MGGDAYVVVWVPKQMRHPYPVVLVHGTRPQIERQMREHGVTPRYVANRRVRAATRQR